MKRFLLWDYPRAVWQYDVMVALILAFIFFTPRDFFRDQPRTFDVAVLPSEQGANVFWLEGELLSGLEEEQRWAKATELISKRSGKKQTVIRLEPLFDNEEQTKGFMVYSNH